MEKLIFEYSKYEARINNKIIILVAGQAGKKEVSFKNAIYANDNELFSEIELEDILNGLRSVTNTVIHYNNEIAFIKDTISGKYDFNEIIVFNLARNGLKEGKKSLIPSFCDLFGIAYTGSNAFVQSLGRNKYVNSNYLSVFGIKIPKTIMVKPWEQFQKIDFHPDHKVIIKPVSESSSIGVSKNVYVRDIVIDKKMFVNNQPILIQRFIEGDEYEVPFFVDKGKIYVMNPVKLISNLGYLTSEVSITNDYYFETCSNQIALELKNKTEMIADKMGIDIYGRIDYRVDKNGRVYLIDIATTPFLSKHSSFSHIFQEMYQYEDIYKIIMVLTYKKFFDNAV